MSDNKFGVQHWIEPECEPTVSAAQYSSCCFDAGNRTISNHLGTLPAVARALRRESMVLLESALVKCVLTEIRVLFWRTLLPLADIR